MPNTILRIFSNDVKLYNNAGTSILSEKAKLLASKDGGLFKDDTWQLTINTDLLLEKPIIDTAMQGKNIIDKASRMLYSQIESDIRQVCTEHNIPINFIQRRLHISEYPTLNSLDLELDGKVIKRYSLNIGVQIETTTT